MTTFRRLIACFDRAISVGAFLAGALLVSVMIFVTVAVLLRYVLNRPIGWAVEVCEYSLVCITFLIAAWVLKREGHVRVDLILSLLPPQNQLILNTITSGLSTLVCLVLTFFAGKVTNELFQGNYFTPTILMIPKFILHRHLDIGPLFAFRAIHQKNLQVLAGLESLTCQREGAHPFVEWQLTLVVVFGSLAVLLASGLPIALSFLLVNVGGAYVYWGTAGLEQLILSMYTSLASFELLPLPLFILMGEVLFHSGVGPMLINVLDKLMGRLPGRLSLLSVAAGVVLAVLTGASVGSVAMLGNTLMPDMLKRGYKKPMAMGPIMASGGLAVMIPPSGLAVLLGAVRRNLHRKDLDLDRDPGSGDGGPLFRLHHRKMLAPAFCRPCL